MDTNWRMWEYIQFQTNFNTMYNKMFNGLESFKNETVILQRSRWNMKNSCKQYKCYFKKRMKDCNKKSKKIWERC